MINMLVALVITGTLGGTLPAAQAWGGGTAPPSGPFKTDYTSFTVKGQDTTDPTVDIYYPTDLTTKNATRKAPLISFAHGDGGGGPIDWVAYIPLLQNIASYGFVVASTRAWSPTR